jgi:plasmid stabilization system protein ParE
MSRVVLKRPQVTRDLAEQAVLIGRDNPDAASRFLHAAEAVFAQLARGYAIKTRMGPHKVRRDFAAASFT